MRILVVEDAERLRRTVCRALRSSGWVVEEASDGEEGLWLAQSNAYDVIVLDVMLPKLDGLALLARLRAEGSAAHVLMLTARDTVADRVRGLSGGADDYLIKPFALEELLARVAALGRRAHGVKHPLVRVGDLEIDTMAKRVRRGGIAVVLRPREYAILELLVLRQGEVVSRAEIESHLYGEGAEVMSNAVDSAISALRKRLAQPGAPTLIQTRHGQGYLLSETAS